MICHQMFPPPGLFIFITITAFTSLYCVHSSPAAMVSKQFTKSLVRVIEGETARYRCKDKLLQGFDYHEVEWYLNNIHVDPNVYGRLHFSKRQERVFIYDVNFGDVGRWSIGVKREGNYIWCNFTVHLRHDPSAYLQERLDAMLNQSSEQHQNGSEHLAFIQENEMEKKRMVNQSVGSTVTLSCPSTGHPKPMIQWYKNGDKVMFHRHLQQRKWTIRFHAVARRDSGNYTCVVFNNAGERIHFTFQLSIKDHPNQPVLAIMRNVTAFPGETARLNCEVISSSISSSQDPVSPFSIEWLRFVAVNGSYVDPSGAPYAEVLEVDEPDGKDRQNLLIENVTINDSGRYACKVKNKYGMAVQSAWLLVAERGEGLNIYVIILSGLSGIILVIFLSFLMVYLWRRRRKQEKLNQNNSCLKSTVHESPSSLSTFGNDPEQALVK